MRFASRFALLLFVVLAGCADVTDDLAPSGSDERPSVEPGSVGPEVGQRAPEFSTVDSLGGPFTLSAALTGSRAVVLYFTMWCPICDGHLSHMEATVVPAFPDVAFVGVDYVSPGFEKVRTSQLENGYGGSPLTFVADADRSILDAYGATMGSTVVIDASGVVRMNEDYKDGRRLADILAGLPAPEAGEGAP